MMRRASAVALGRPERAAGSQRLLAVLGREPQFAASGSSHWLGILVTLLTDLPRRAGCKVRSVAESCFTPFGRSCTRVFGSQVLVASLSCIHPRFIHAIRHVMRHGCLAPVFDAAVPCLHAVADVFQRIGEARTNRIRIECGHTLAFDSKSVSSDFQTCSLKPGKASAASVEVLRLKYIVPPRLNLYCGSLAAALPPVSSRLRTFALD